MKLGNIRALCRDTGEFKMVCQMNIDVVNQFTNFEQHFE
jgi:hypothetical protein